MPRIEDVLAVPHSDIMFGTGGGLAAIMCDDNGRCYIGGADSAIKTFDLTTRDMVSEFVVEVFDKEVEISCFEIYKDIQDSKSFLIFGTKSGIVAFLPLSTEMSFAKEDICVIFKDSKPIRVLKSYSNFLAIGTSNSSVRIVNLEKINSQDFEDIVSVSIEEAAGAVKSIEIFLNNDKICMVVTNCDGGMRVFKMIKSASLSTDGFKLTKRLENVFTKDKDQDLANLNRNSLAVDSVRNALYLAGESYIRTFSTESWKEEAKIGKDIFSEQVLALRLSSSGKVLFASSKEKIYAAFNVETKQELFQAELEEPVQQIAFSASLKTSVPLLENGDFYILTKLLKDVHEVLLEDEQAEDSLAPSVQRTAPDLEVGIESDDENDEMEKTRARIRQEIDSNLSGMLKQNESEASSSTNIDELMKKVMIRLGKTKQNEVGKILQPNSTLVEIMEEKESSTSVFGNDNKPSILAWNNQGSILKKSPEIELKFANMSRKNIRINMMETGRDFTLGSFNDKALILCTQIQPADGEDDETEARVNGFSGSLPYKRTVLGSCTKISSLDDEGDLNGKSILQKAFEEAEKQERMKNYDNEENEATENSKKQSVIYYRDISSSTTFGKKQTEWTLELAPETKSCCGESAILCCAGEDFVAVVTDLLNLRIIRHSGLQEPPIRMTKLVRSVVAMNQMLFVLFDDGSFEWYEVPMEGTVKGGVIKLKNSGEIPFGCIDDLKWVGFSDRSLPSVLSQNELFTLLPGSGNWTRVFVAHDKRIWPISIVGGNLLGLSLEKGVSCPKVAGKHVVENFKLNLDLIGFDPRNPSKVGSLKHRLEDSALKAGLFEEKDEEAIDSILLKHLMLSVKLEKWSRALGLIKRMSTKSKMDKAAALIRKSCSLFEITDELEDLLEKKRKETRVAPRDSLTSNMENLRKLANVRLSQGVFSSPVAMVDTEGKEQENALSPGKLTPKLERQSTFAKEARVDSLKKQRLF